MSLNTINWYDWISPTNPFAAAFLGLFIILVASLTYWYESRKVKEPLIVFFTGVSFVLLGVFLLHKIGFY